MKSKEIINLFNQKDIALKSFENYRSSFLQTEDKKKINDYALKVYGKLNSLLNEIENKEEAKAYFIEMLQNNNSNLPVDTIANCIFGDNFDNLSNLYKDDLEKAPMESILSFFNNIVGEEELDNALAEIEDPSISNELKVAVETGVNPYVSSLDQKYGYSNRSNEVSYDAFKKDGPLLKKLLTNLNKGDSLYEDRIADIANYLALNATGTNFHAARAFTKEERKDPQTYVTYIKDLFDKCPSLAPYKVDYYTNVDFDKINELALNKFQDEEYVEQIEELKTIWNVESNNFEMDKTLIVDRFANCETAKDYATAYKALVNDIISGNTVLNSFPVTEFEKDSIDIGDVSKFICDAYKSRTGNVLEQPGFDILAINRDLVDPFVQMKYIEQTFKESTEYELNEEEIGLVNSGKEKTLNGEELTTEERNAMIKAEGVDCDKNSEVLNSAVRAFALAKEERAKRPWYYFITHPINNIKEYNMVNRMEAALKTKYHMTSQELNNKVNEVKALPMYKTFDQIEELRFKEPHLFAKHIQNERTISENVKNYLQTKIESQAVINPIEDRVNLNLEESNLNQVEVKEENKYVNLFEKFKQTNNQNELNYEDFKDFYEENPDLDYTEIEKLVDEEGYEEDRQEALRDKEQEEKELKAVNDCISDLETATGFKEQAQTDMQVQKWNEEIEKKQKEFNELSALYKKNQLERDRNEANRQYNTKTRIMNFVDKVSDYYDPRDLDDAKSQDSDLSSDLDDNRTRINVNLEESNKDSSVEYNNDLENEGQKENEYEQENDLENVNLDDIPEMNSQK